MKNLPIFLAALLAGAAQAETITLEPSPGLGAVKQFHAVAKVLGNPDGDAEQSHGEGRKRAGAALFDAVESGQRQHRTAVIGEANEI